MVQLTTLITTLASLAVLGARPAAAQEWYVLGVKDDWTYQRAGAGSYTTHDYSIGAMAMSTRQEEDTKHSAIGRSSRDICGAKLMGAEVWCWGDVTKRCSGYEVAAFKSRRCRTFCPDIGDKSPLYNHNLVFSGSWFTADLVCDRPYP